jgi:hypothetical protein
MGLMLGGERCWKKRRAKGGLAIFYEWFEGKATLFITREHQSALSGNKGSCAIAQDCAWMYADSKTGAPTQRLIAFAMQACVELGLEPSRMNVKAIADAVVDGLEDLLRMPPEPTHKQFTGKMERPLGEIDLKVDGQTVVSTEIH